jgi:phage-related minor tail protein
VGLAQAQNEAMLRLTDNAAFAKDMFNMTMDGFSSAILKFAETGKLSFKDLFRTLMAELIKLQAQKLFLSLFGDGTKGTGIITNFVSGIFGKKAVGGPVMAGTPYMIGERGPELFIPSGPGTVVANDRMGGGGVTQITYNIQAVDALSFKQLVARDPEFIYSVSQAGARRLPR